MTLRRLGLAIVVLALLVGGVVLSSRLSCGKPSKTDTEAKTQVDSLPTWKKEVRDSQAALDSLALIIAKVRADSAKVAQQVTRLRHRKDSLARVAAMLQAAVESLPVLAADASASDSSAHWWSMALGQGQVIRTMAQEILACRQGDGIYERRLGELQRGLTACEKRAAIFEGQRNRAQIRLDRSVGLLDKMLKEKKQSAKFLGFLPSWTDEALLVTGGLLIGKALP